jgi:hypothetical protein
MERRLHPAGVPIAERPGGVNVADNVVRHAAGTDVNSRDEGM